MAQRARRIPLQHLVGSAAFGPIEVRVGPGVFIPRPETESLYVWAAGQLAPNATVVELCAGSAALAIALSQHEPTARVTAIEVDVDALVYTRRNAAGTRVGVIQADVTSPDLLTELNGTVDLIVANPPYIPEDAELEPEVARHDPPQALFAGADGLAIIAPIVIAAGRLLAPGAPSVLSMTTVMVGEHASCLRPVTYSMRLCSGTTWRDGHDSSPLAGKSRRPRLGG